MAQILRSIFTTAAIIADVAYEYSMYLCRQRTHGEYISRLLEKLISRNILFVKLFQGLSANAYLADDTTACLMQYTTNTPYAADDIDYNTLIHAINTYNVQLHNNAQPINSGMISIIYRGTLRDTSKEVIIKLRKNNIRERIVADCTYMYHVYAATCVLIYPFTNGVLLMVLKSLINSSEYLVDQCDFTEEAANMAAVRDDLAKLPVFVVPQVYTNKEPNFIIMEYLSGVPISDIPPEHYEQYAMHLITYVVYVVLYCSNMHLDMHYGNLVFINDANELKIGLIDYGIIMKLNYSLKKSLVKTLELFYRCSAGKYGKFNMIKLANSMFEPPMSDAMVAGYRDKICKVIMEYTDGIFSGIFNDRVLGETILKISKITGTQCRFKIGIGRVFMGMTIANRVILRFIEWDKKKYITMLLQAMDTLSMQ